MTVMTPRYYWIARPWLHKVHEAMPALMPLPVCDLNGYWRKDGGMRHETVKAPSQLHLEWGVLYPTRGELKAAAQRLDM